MIRNSRGVTLVELMVATAIISVGVLGLVGAFAGIQKGVQITKEKTIANNLAQEKIESLKNISYYRLLVTTQTATDSNFSPAMTYDVAPHGVETPLSVGGINFQRRVIVRKVSENASGNLIDQAWNAADTGLKEVIISVVWKSGNDWKKVELRNLRDNPNRQVLSASFTGTARDSASAAALENVTVQAMQNTSRYDASDAAGAYSFTIEPGSYTLRASKLGYFISYSNSLVAAADVPVTQNFNLLKMASGTISGTAYMRDHLVISQVAASSGTQGGVEVEFVELYNPTTYAWTMNASTLELMYRNKNSGPAMAEINLTFNTGSLPTLRYFLIASTSPVNFRGLSRTADAVYNEASLDKIVDASDGGVGIRAQAASSWYDRFAWQKSGGSDAPSELVETTPLEFGGGLEDGEQLVRRSSATGVTAGSGRAYDSNSNNVDLSLYETPSLDAQNSTVTESPTTGTPASGALVFADDGLSNGAAVSATGSFALVSVATGTWTVVISSGLVTQTTGLYGGLLDGYSTTTVAMFLTNVSSTGYISGNVATITGTNLANILVEAGGGTDRTDAAGNYLLTSSTGTVPVVVNRGGDNPLYVEATSNVTFGLGALATANFALSQGGKITGTVTSNGVDALPNIPVTASVGGVTQGTGVSGTTGAFEILSLSTGSYVVAPQLEAGETASPSSTTVSVTAGGTGAAGSFTVSGALGYISGSLTLGSLTGSAITTGVLIYATTSTITSDPPSITAAVRSGSSVYYAASSLADGTYEVGVRGGATYNVYAWYTTWSGDTPTTVRKTATAVVAAGATVDKDFFW